MSGRLWTWDLWYPHAAATGLPFARGRADPTDRMLVHAAPDSLTVQVFSESGTIIARATDLKRTQTSPICLLSRSGDTVRRDDIWPTEAELGLPVLLPGGEVGFLRAWWNAPDRQEWRWRVEFYNSLRGRPS